MSKGFAHLTRGTQERVGERTPGEEKAWSPPGERLSANEAVLRWIATASGSEELAFSSDDAGALLSGEVGSVEIPFKHALRHLKLGSSFEVAMRAVLAGGGDSSASAAAVGGLIGAAVGLEGIPARWIKAVLDCDTSSGQPRSEQMVKSCRLVAMYKIYQI